MLRELRDALAHADGPMRLDDLARRVGTDTATVAAALAHPATRSLIGLAPVAATACETGCASSGSACRRCPAAGVRPLTGRGSAVDGQRSSVRG
jgi:hypothetical protein